MYSIMIELFLLFMHIVCLVQDTKLIAHHPYWAVLIE